jgi:hypothetical protein
VQVGQGAELFFFSYAANSARKMLFHCWTKKRESSHWGASCGFWRNDDGLAVDDSNDATKFNGQCYFLIISHLVYLAIALTIKRTLSRWVERSLSLGHRFNEGLS